MPKRTFGRKRQKPSNIERLATKYELQQAHRIAYSFIPHVEDCVVLEQTNDKVTSQMRIARDSLTWFENHTIQINALPLVDPIVQFG